MPIECQSCLCQICINFAKILNEIQNKQNHAIKTIKQTTCYYIIILKPFQLFIYHMYWYSLLKLS